MIRCVAVGRCALKLSAVIVSSDNVKRLDERLTAARLAGVLESIGEGLLVEDETGSIVWANEAAALMIGVGSSAELVGGSLRRRLRRGLTDETGRPLDPDQLPGARLFRGESAQTTVVRLLGTPAVRESWAWVRASLIHGLVGRAPLVASVWRDVTDERRSQESARYLARATAILSESLDYGATLKRMACVLVPELADWYCVDVLDGGELRAIAVEHADPAKAGLAREVHVRHPARLDDEKGPGAVVRTGRSELTNDFGDDVLVAKARGEPDLLAMLRALRPCSAMFVPLKSGGQTFGAMKLCTAESGRRYDESDLATAEELGRRIGMAIENARSYREAREAIRLRDEFLAVAGHELRTPLTALKLQLQAVAGSVSRGESVAPRVDKTLVQVGRLQQLIDRLLDVSQITSRPLALDRQEVNLAELWRAVIERHVPEGARAGSVVSFTSSGATVGHWDRARMDQVLTSLLGNALKYGNGKPVRVSLHGDLGTVRILVQDEGMGIDLSAQSRMFGRFERAVSVRNYGGFGLGLWIVRELVEQHGGTVGFESQPGRGSTFWVELPCMASPT